MHGDGGAGRRLRKEARGRRGHAAACDGAGAGGGLEERAAVRTRHVPVPAHTAGGGKRHAGDAAARPRPPSSRRLSRPALLQSTPPLTCHAYRSPRPSFGARPLPCMRPRGTRRRQLALASSCMGGETQCSRVRQIRAVSFGARCTPHSGMYGMHRASFIHNNAAPRLSADHSLNFLLGDCSSSFPRARFRCARSSL